MLRFGSYILGFLILALLTGCQTNKKEKAEKASKEEVTLSDKRIINDDFQKILDSADVIGSILVYNPQKKEFYSNDFEWAELGRLPASTFKIANTIIGLETGVIEGKDKIFKWGGESRALEVWEQDLILKEAFQRSCVPCYQEVARGIGPDRMNKYLNKLEYGDIEVDSANIDMFWLVGDSKISPFQQIDFLQRLYRKELPISSATYEIIKEILILEKSDEYCLSAKTGWAIREGQNNGWFVGYLEKEKDLHYFATNIIPNEAFNMDMFPVIRQQITMKALKKMGIIE